MRQKSGPVKEPAAQVLKSIRRATSLQASLMARLDRLGLAREVAQLGAAIGREFSHALLGAVARKPEQELASALDRLVAAGLVFRQGTPPLATYLFKHALCQSALERGSDATLVQLDHAAPINLACSRSILPRPYIWRRTSLRRVI